MVLPYAERAVVDIRKLRDYCLNPQHDEGKHKARLFAALGLDADDAEELRAILLRMVKTNDARPGRRDAYGQRYVVDFFLVRRGKRIPIRSGWIIEHGRGIPKLTTCYPL